MCPNIRCDRNFRRSRRNQTWPKYDMFFCTSPWVYMCWSPVHFLTLLLWYGSTLSKDDSHIATHFVGLAIWWGHRVCINKSAPFNWEAVSAHTSLRHMPILSWRMNFGIVTCDPHAYIVMVNEFWNCDIWPIDACLDEAVVIIVDLSFKELGTYFLRCNSSSILKLFKVWQYLWYKMCIASIKIYSRKNLYHKHCQTQDSLT